MDALSFPFYLFAFASTAYVTHIGLYLIGANCYDIWQHYRYTRRHIRGGLESLLERSPNDSSLPLVTVAIPAHNEEKVIVRCLESIRQSDYKKIQVIVADDYSMDRTKQLVRDYIVRHPELDLRVYRMHKNVGKGAALSNVIRRYGHGQFVMMIDADSIIGPSAIRRALKYFDDPTVAGVAANVQIIYDPTILGILQKFEHMVGYRAKKLYSLINGEFVVGGVASTYRMDILRRVNYYDTDSVTEDIGLSLKIVSCGNKANRMVYGADILAMTEGVGTLKALVRQRFRWKYGCLQCLMKYRRLVFNLSGRYSLGLTLYRLPLAIVSEFILLSAPVAWFYAFYMTLNLYSMSLVAGAYLTITAYTLIAIWFDENLRLPMKFRLTFYAPIAYFIFYIMELVQLIAICRCIGRLRALVLQKDIGSTWTPAARLGKELTPNEA